MSHPMEHDAKFDEFTDELWDCGWRATCDAQHMNIIPLYLRVRAGDQARIENAKLDEKLKMIAIALGDTNPEGTFIQARLIRGILGNYALPLTSDAPANLIKDNAA